VANVNRAPLLTNPGDQTSGAGEWAFLWLDATDPDGDPLTYSATGLPAGLELDAEYGLISGVIEHSAAVTNNGVYMVSVSASDGTATTTHWFVWYVQFLPLTLETPGDQTNVEGDVIWLYLFAGGGETGTFTFTATGLPAGLAIDSETGEIWGTLDSTTAETNDGIYLVTVAVSDGVSSVSQDFVWTVATAPLRLLRPSDLGSWVGEAISLQVSVTGGEGSYSFAAAGLPDGLSISAATGLISGTLSASVAGTNSGRHTVTVAVTDDADVTVSAAFDWYATALLWARDDEAATTNGVPVTIPVLDNDSDPAGYTFEVVAATTPVHGTVTFTETAVTYTPPTGFWGDDSFLYTIRNSVGHETSAIVSVWVGPSITPPEAGDLTVETNQNQPVVITLPATDSNGGRLTYTIVSPPAHGTLSAIWENQVVYMPAGNYAGTDSFTFTVNDGFADSEARTVDITVVPVAVQPGLTITPHGGALEVAEGGQTKWYTVVLNTQPTAPVTVTITTDGQVGVSQQELTFTPSNWDIPQAVEVTAVADDLAEGDHEGIIVHVVDSADPDYSSQFLAAQEVRAKVADNYRVTITLLDPVPSTVLRQEQFELNFRITVTTGDGDPLPGNIVGSKIQLVIDIWRADGALAELHKVSWDDYVLEHPGRGVWVLPENAPDTTEVSAFISYLRPGDKNIKLYASAYSNRREVGEGDRVEVNVKAADVIISPDPIVTGVRKIAVDELVGIERKNVTLKVFNKDLVRTLDVHVYPRNGDNILDSNAPGGPKILNVRRDPMTGTMTFDVNGGALLNDTQEGAQVVKAKNRGETLGTAAIRVVYPKRVEPKDPSPTTWQITPQNIALGESTSPKWVDVNLPSDMLTLGTFYGVFITIKVFDQFGKPLSDVYKGQPVSERFEKGKDEYGYINQNLAADGTYQDPVGVIQLRPDKPHVAKDDFETIVAWQYAAPVAFAGISRRFQQNIWIQIAGIRADEIDRTLIFTDDLKKLTVAWKPV